MKHDYDPDEDWAETCDEFIAQGFDEKRAAGLASLCVAATLARRRVKRAAEHTADQH